VFDIATWLDNLAVEFIIAIVFTGVGVLIPRIRRRMDLSEFQRAFGDNVQTARDIFFSIPLWSLKERKRTISRFLRVDPSGRREEFYGPSNTFAREDILGAVYVSEMMARRAVHCWRPAS
jgi:hypothetical protein